MLKNYPSKIKILDKRMFDEITIIWNTDELKRSKPTPSEEARWGLAIIEDSLWETIPKVYRRLNQIFVKNMGKGLPKNFNPIEFGSWMGGDRLNSKNSGGMVLMNSKDVSAEFSFEKEKAIAKSFSQRFQWEMILIGIGQAMIWLSLWPLVINGIIPLWAGFCIASLCACFAYLPSHESQHGNYSRGNPKMRWLDSLVGHITLITLISPYEILRVTHMKHHAYTNDHEKDPDYLSAHSGSLIKTIKRAADGSSVSDYEKCLEVFAHDKNFVNSYTKAIPIALLYRATLLTLVVIFFQ